MENKVICKIYIYISGKIIKRLSVRHCNTSLSKKTNNTKKEKTYKLAHYDFRRQAVYIELNRKYKDYFVCNKNDLDKNKTNTCEVQAFEQKWV